MCSTLKPPSPRASTSTAKSRWASTSIRPSRRSKSQSESSRTQSVDVGFQCRNAPPIAAIAEKIKAGALGKIATVSGLLLRARLEGKGLPRRRHRRVSPAQLALGPRALRRHPRRAEHPHHRPLQLDAGRAPAEGHGHRRPQHPHPCRRLLGQLPGGLHLSRRRALFVCVHAVRRLRHVRRRAAAVRLRWCGDGSLLRPDGDRRRAALGVEGFNEYARRRPASSPPTAHLATTWPSPIATRSAPSSTASSTDRCHNQIAAGVETALSCMLGRMAGLRGHEVTWEELERTAKPTNSAWTSASSPERPGPEGPGQEPGGEDGRIRPRHVWAEVLIGHRPGQS